MHSSVRSPLSIGFAVVAISAAAVASPPPPLPVSAPVASPIRLAADAVPLGGLLTSFAGNQLIYCSIICPDLVRLAATVPAGAVAAPAAFVTSLSSGNLLNALGAAVASVTNPLDAAFDPIITNDLTLVLPRAQNALAVGVVGLLDIAAAGPLGVVDAIQTARQNTFDALNDTIPPSQTSPNPRGLIQVVAVESINVASSILFQAFEEGLLGIVQTVDSSATALAQTGNPVVAFAAGERAATASFGKALGYIGTATHTAVVNISAALHDPLPAQDMASLTPTPTPTAAVRTTRMRGADGSPAIAKSRDVSINQNKTAGATRTVKLGAAKQSLRNGLANLGQALRRPGKATAVAEAGARDTAAHPGEARARSGKGAAVKLRHALADAANG